MKIKGNTETILHGSMVKAILSLAIPVMLNSFLQTMYNLTDTFWLGKLGTEELAAINLVSPVQNIVVNFGSGLTVAGAVLIAQHIGAGQKDEAKKMANQIFACSMIFAIACALILNITSGFIVDWLGADVDIRSHAVRFLSICILDMPFLFMVNMYQSINQAQGNTLSPMLLNFGGICINMILDPLFMMILKLGVAGAALATITAKAVPAVIAFILLSDKEKDISLDIKNIKFEKEKLKAILTVGLPTAIGGSTMQFGFLLMSKNVLGFGTKAMAAYGIGNKCNGVITLPSNGLGSAVSTIVGQNMGAKQPERAEKGYLMSIAFSMSFLFIGGMILSRPFVSTAIVSIFSKDPDVVAMSADFLSIMAFWCFMNGITNSSTGLFNGTGHTEVTMIVEASRLWVFRFATLFICRDILGMGVRSVWYSVVVSNGIGAIILFIVYKTGYWKKKRIKV